MGEQQLLWLENYLHHVPADRLLVFMMHIPLHFSQEKSDHVNVVDRERLYEIVKDRKHLLALAGHMHVIDQVDMGASVGRDDSVPFPMLTLAAVSGSWWSGPRDERGIPISMERDGTPNGYHIFHFKGNRFTQELRPSRYDKSYQMNISYPVGIIEQQENNETPIMVNVFNADDSALVHCRIDDGKPVAMQQQVMQDPFSVEYHETYRDMIPGWIRPSTTSHLWSAPMPESLEPGVHRVTVEVVDQYGFGHKQTQLFEVQ
jgi:hypothetical protein